MCAVVAYLGVQVYDRRRSEVDGVAGVVGADEEVRVAVPVQVHAGGQGPTERTDDVIDLPGVDHLQPKQGRS